MMQAGNYNFELSSANFTAFRDSIHEKSGIYFAENKKYLVENRLSDQMATLDMTLCWDSLAPGGYPFIGLEESLRGIIKAFGPSCLKTGIVYCKERSVGIEDRSVSKLIAAFAVSAASEAISQIASCSSPSTIASSSGQTNESTDGKLGEGRELFTDSRESPVREWGAI